MEGDFSAATDNDGGDAIIQKLAPVDSSCAGPTGGALIGIGGAVEVVDELARTRGDAAEGGEDEGSEGSTLVEASSSVVAIFLLLPCEKHGPVIEGGRLAVGGEERVRDGDIDCDGRGL